MTPTLEALLQDLKRECPRSSHVEADHGLCEPAGSCLHCRAAAALKAAHAEGARTHARMLDEGVQWNDGYAKGLAEGARQALEALEPFASGGNWGKVKAWIVNGAPDRETGIDAAKHITAAQVLVDEVLALARAEEGNGPHE